MRAGEITINGEIGGNADLAAHEIRLGPKAVINGNLRYRTPRPADLIVSPGATIEGHAYLSGVVAAHTAKFVAVWMTATGALSGDSTSAATAAATKFTMDLAKRTL